MKTPLETSPFRSPESFINPAQRAPLKVLMTTDTVGGVWTYVMELCGAFCTMGISVELASMGRALSAEQHQQLKQLPNVRVHESEFRLCWMKDPWEDVEAAGRWLLELEQHLQPDLIHLNDLAHGNLPWQSPVLLVGHSCVYSWHHAVKGTPPDEHWQRYRRCVSDSIGAVDLLVAPSRTMLDNLLRFYGPVSHSSVVYNGRDFFTASSLGNKHWRQLAAAKKPFIFAAGRLWDEAKNMAALTRIARYLPWPIYLAGETKEPHAQHTRCASEDVKYLGVKYLGLLDHDALSQWLSRAGIYAAPAYYEPFGLGILEAAQAGCALVLGDIPSLRELWEDAAVFVPPDDPIALGRELKRLTQQDLYRRELGQQAWQRSQQFSTQRMAAEYRQCYQDLLNDQTTTQAIGAIT